MEERIDLMKMNDSYSLNNLETGLSSTLKRGFDIVFSIVGLVPATPIVLVTTLAIVVESPGNPFYLQKRLGLLGKEFKVIKLRSMRLDAEKNGAKWADKNDDRITKVGHFIRKTRIDELPQLINVLKGDMSIIGPRPERKIFVDEFSKEIPNFPKRMEVKPGLTGWAQVNGGYDISPKEKLELDLHYIKNKSLKMDLAIFLKTVGIVLTGEGAR
ncbi:exopolysaccharide biosynthesis polyprenyl glycosylphosphotransferase [Enterococcus faecalis]|uniref:sugar transferase n=1 Tax=Enterococcus faecalis TaxID=1351 RepID=UPI000CF08717|nr:exopolysaccharide biosynthesis polyprenyl glycosylphosphotransferase [Enterococcus faecalis]EME7228163.1 exopolysaccharide biosynthesis polyprenyl glycosylphosphotransferase [Enterococcus faecium]EJJ1465390.1 exopolysaccharide biosynthesis polyprenyl glycosylphosphotransferase [Enterococcus faecalis]EMF0443809.1 exopolysaccharide biosynthesis polyprenyl glycosylphosphotransferase [Enterococcus faecium]PQC45129.1 UDP-phosphate N-acetylgalactosaminyl-1-phosphate transferase [Enterococcus faeca